MLLFNSDQRQGDHESAALAAAIEMRGAYRNSGERWVTLGYAGAGVLFVRFGLSTGLVARTELGHNQARRITVIGAAINSAAHACEKAPRDRDTICLTRDPHDALGSLAKVDAAPFAAGETTLFEVRG